MTTYVRAIRDDGSVIIDDTYKTLSLKEIQTVSITAGTTPVSHTITATGDNVMVAVRSEQLHCAMYLTQVSGTTWSTTCIFVSDAGSVTENVKFYIFTDPIITAGDYVRVRNSAGDLLFSDSTKPIKIRGNVGGTSGFTGVSGRIYAPIMLSRADGIIFFNGVLWDIYYYFLRCSTHTVSATQKIVRRQTGVRRTTTGQYLVADVTDY